MVSIRLRKCEVDEQLFIVWMNASYFSVKYAYIFIGEAKKSMTALGKRRDNMPTSCQSFHEAE